MSTPSRAPSQGEDRPALSTMQEQHPRKLRTLERNASAWDTNKEEIRKIYMEEDRTLKDTMHCFELRGFSWR